MYKSFENFDLSIFDFKSPNRHKKTTLFLFRSDKVFPNFNLYPLTNKLDMPLFKYHKVDFEKFHIATTKYCLKSTDPNEAKKFITKSVVKQLEMVDNALMEARSNYFLIFRAEKGLALEEETNNFLPEAIALFQSFITDEIKAQHKTEQTAGVGPGNRCDFSKIYG